MRHNSHTPATMAATDLTLGQLLKMHETEKEQAPTADKLLSGANVTPFKRGFYLRTVVSRRMPLFDRKVRRWLPE
jgi:hypothetical protein